LSKIRVAEKFGLRNDDLDQPRPTFLKESPQNVTKCHKVSQSVTKCHNVSQSVTKCHKVSPHLQKKKMEEGTKLCLLFEQNS